MEIRPKKREEMLEFCRLAGAWYLNNQSTAERPWGEVGGSADEGRFVYQYEPLTGRCRASSVWAQALAIKSLLPLARRLGRSGEGYRQAALAGAPYLLSLQVLDRRDEKNFGAFRQSNPQTAYLYPRDGATGCMGLCVLHLETGEEEYLYRARLYGDWYIRNATDRDGWPAYTWHLDRREGEWRQPGAWQAGAGLAFYFLYRLTGERRWLDEGLLPLMDGYRKIVSEEKGGGEFDHDDFATVSALGACLVSDDRRLLECASQRCRAGLAEQEEDGSCPGLAGGLISGLTWQVFCRFARERKLDLDTRPYEEAIRKALDFLPGLQERELLDTRAHGGVYGQSRYGVGRTVIHHRSAGYGLVFMLRAEGGVEVPAYDIFGWEKERPAS